MAPPARGRQWNPTPEQPPDDSAGLRALQQTRLSEQDRRIEIINETLRMQREAIPAIVATIERQNAIMDRAEKNLDVLDARRRAKEKK
jgi:uncharacterized coiled-coil protein SlyX